MKMKNFPLIDFFDSLKKIGLKRTTQLFLISLIAHYHERQRSKGKIIDINIGTEKGEYKVTISDSEIQKKFKFSIDTIISAKRELQEKVPIKIEFVGVVSAKKKFKKYRYPELSPIWANKYKDYEERYIFDVLRMGRRIIYVPTKIIYDRNLSYSEKLATLWNISLKEKLGRKPKLKEIERYSGISEKTVRKAKNKYPRLFE